MSVFGRIMCYATHQVVFRYLFTIWISAYLHTNYHNVTCKHIISSLGLLIVHLRIGLQIGSNQLER